ncbi:SSS family solute:Na+ symporter [Lewinella marina]|uniref:Sodium:solute symporter n=1 Tax=Neolewinella marina TaxID=438751 RepID=A0A2G0CIH6_9BACT|nr:sodium:solute symporter family protein [Neolewinella marina]NJB85104.1 SSS family solute:Na+ symporter [Neolewinella marina]PHK99758.1 sodium:solute symporter [Neolewinella marina]
MLQALIIVGTIYVILLVGVSLWQRRGPTDSKSYLLAGGSLGSILGLFTFAATLFSTFTLLGMPDFFRVHGVGAWTFLAVSDMALIFGVIWIGYHFRRVALREGYWGMAGFLNRRYGNRLAGGVAFFGVFVFLIPYVAIQIKGVSDFVAQAFPDLMPIWGWSVMLVAIMLLYSELGGLKAIVYNDAMQGLVLLVVIWIVGLSCLSEVGGLEAGYAQLQEQDSALLTVPGPRGLFTPQFLIGSAVAILMIPFTQPQVSIRLAIMKDDRSMYRMAVGVGTFAILVILPTAFIGLYGSLRYPELSAFEFLGQALIRDQPATLAAFVIIGLLAAAISTADSQIFALGTELRSILTIEDDERLLRITKIGIGAFALLALGFSIVSSDQLALLARTSFAGTSLLAPLIFTAIFASPGTGGRALPLITLAGILLFIASLLGWVPETVGPLRLDLLLLLSLGIAAIIIVLLGRTGGEREPAHS